jgi:hypothetical protein
MSATEILHTQKTPVILSGFSLLVYLITNIIIKIRINQYLNEPEALKSLYRSPGYKKNQLVLCKNYVLQW